MIYQIQADNNEINVKNVQDWINAFKTFILPKREKLGAYYDGENTIVKQGAVKNRPNYSINVNMAKYIIDVATGYTFGIPVTYDTKDENTKIVLDKIQHINKNNNVAELDFQQGGDMATYGVSYQLVLVPEGTGNIEDRIIFKHLDPLTTFYVTDNTILKSPLCAVYYYNYFENKQIKTKVCVYDSTDLYIFDGFDTNLILSKKEAHNMGYIPIIQSLNNDDAFSDTQGVIELLDSLSLAVSNNTDDLQSIANAILAFFGAVMTDEVKADANDEKILNMPQGSDAKWLTKQIDSASFKTQIDTLLKFIFQISQVPDLTDDAFGGNQSGVAMQYKLWGLNQLYAAKVTKYTKSLYHRLKILLHLLQYQIKNNVELLNNIEITFYKNLPTDNSGEYQMVQALKGMVSDRTLLSNISIVDDVDKELEALDEQAQKNADLYGFNNNSNLNEENDKEDEQ